MVKGSIRFPNIKAHGGSQNRAFEEMCYQLFATHFCSQGKAFRRDGAGGDGGLEGFVSDALGKTIIGLQAKFFVQKFGPAQWAQIDNSVATVLRDNAKERSLRSIVIAIPREFNKTGQSRWDEHRLKWIAQATRDFGSLVSLAVINSTLPILLRGLGNGSG